MRAVAAWVDWFVCGLEWGLRHDYYPESEEMRLMTGTEPDSWYTGHRVGRRLRDGYDRVVRAWG